MNIFKYVLNIIENQLWVQLGVFQVKVIWTQKLINCKNHSYFNVIVEIPGVLSVVFKVLLHNLTTSE